MGADEEEVYHIRGSRVPWLHAWQLNVRKHRWASWHVVVALPKNGGPRMSSGPTDEEKRGRGIRRTEAGYRGLEWHWESGLNRRARQHHGASSLPFLIRGS